MEIIGQLFMKKHYSFLFLLSTLILFGCNTNKGFVKFYPVEWDENSEVYYYYKDYSDEFLQNFIKVLDCFNEEYKFIKGKLYISRELYEDKEFLWNLCNKSQTTEWLEQREAALGKSKTE